MVAKNIKTDYGAVGDGQKINATISLTPIGSTDLVVTGNYFKDPDDIGKPIAIQDAGAFDSQSLLSNLRATIAAVGAFSGGVQHITLNTGAIQAVASAAKDIEWGTDDHAAFNTFVALFQSQTGVELDMPAGRYCVVGGSFNNISMGISALRVVGASTVPATSIISDLLGTGQGMFFGSRPFGGVFSDNLHNALTEAVSAGSTTIILKNLSDAALFSINTYALMTGFETQDTSGAPSNQAFFEYVYITGISGKNITIREPTNLSYKTTWPHYFGGSIFTLDCGGPAMLYAIDQRWDCSHEYIDIGIEQLQGENLLCGRSITQTRGHGHSIGPSQIKKYTLTDFTNQSFVEVDKMISEVEVDGGTHYGYDFQSADPWKWTMRNATVTNVMNGTPARFIADNCVFPASMSFGPHSYGPCEVVYCKSCTFPSLIVNSASENDVLGAGGYTYHNGGSFTRAQSGGAPTWARPNGYVAIEGDLPQSYAFKVFDVQGDGTTITISTNLPDNWQDKFPHVNNGGAIKFRAHPCKNLTFINCVGCDTAKAFSNLLPCTPWGEGWNLTYTGDIGTSKPVIPVFGKVVSIKFTVNVAFSAGSFNLGGPFVVKQSDGTKVIYSPSIDLTRTGQRVVTPLGVTGAGGLDSPLDLPDVNTWLSDNQITPQMIGATGSGSITLEIVTDQGIDENGYTLIN